MCNNCQSISVMILIRPTFVFSLLLLSLRGAELSSYHSHRAKYGEHCNKTVRCDTSSLLTCTNFTCDCYKTDAMYYDPILKLCSVLVGEKCIYPLQTFNNNENTNGLIQYAPAGRYRGFQEELDCVQNAWCNGSGVCMCSEGYIELSNGTCITKRNFEEACATDFECRQDRFLSCINGKCGCNETSSAYNSLLRQCVGKAGQPCLGIDACVYNADCTANSFSLYEKRRMKQSIKICSCNSGFVADSSGRCKVGLGGQCSEARPCADTFKCTDGQCVCKYENLQLAMMRSQTCVSLVGGPCNETVVATNSNSSTSSSSENNNNSTYELFQCVENANCVSVDGNSSLHECKCNSGFVSNKAGSCDLAFGESCSVSSFHRRRFHTEEEGDADDSKRRQTPVCDQTTPLFCVNGVCKCESSLYVFNGNGTCLGKYGAKCNMLNSNDSNYAKPLTNGTILFHHQCIPGAECLSSRDSTPLIGKCVCSSGFSINSNRTCSKNSG